MENKIVEKKIGCECKENEQGIARVAIVLSDTDTDDVVTIPRDEYNEMVAECTILRVVEKLVETTKGDYGDFTPLRTVLSLAGDDEPEDEAE